MTHSESSNERRPHATRSIALGGQPVTMDVLLRLTVDEGASDLHFTAGTAPHLRIDGYLVPVACDPLSGAEIQQLIYALLTPERIQKFERDRELDFSFPIEGLARFRANYYFQRGDVGAAFRMLPTQILTFEQLGIPAHIANDFCNRKRGLVLVTGATGSGKSTTLASMLNMVNRERPCHVITVEDPIQYVHTNQRSIFEQREIGSDTHSFTNALKYVLRQDPDVILIGEMRDLETIGAALTIAETGHLVFATLHTSDAVQTINRIIDVFPSHQQEQVRTQLSFVLLGVFSQQLLPSLSGKGRALACEVLVANHAVRTLIRDRKAHQMYSVIQTGQKEGMQTMNAALCELCVQRRIGYEDALGHSSDPEELRHMVKVAGVI